jgi:hypothetical protein
VTLPETLAREGPAPRIPSICVATIHHVRQCAGSELKIDRLMEALNMQTDLPERVLILDTRPFLPGPHLERYPGLAGRVRTIASPMKTVQEGFNFYARARNQLLAECREDVVIWLDADEWPGPDLVGRLRTRFSDPSVDAAILCLRPSPGYWRTADELQYFAKEGHVRARLRIFRTDLLRSLGGFEPGKPEWGNLSSRINLLAGEGRVAVSHERLCASHDSSPGVGLHTLRLLLMQSQPRSSIRKARALLGAFALWVVAPIILGAPAVGLSILFLVPGLLFLVYLVRCLRALGRHETARPIHAPGASLVWLLETADRVLAAALGSP